jgi:hypothetical protein
MSKHVPVTSETVAAARPVASPIPEIAGIGNLSVRKLGKPHMHSPAITIELIATVGLALSTLVAITVVSIGIARADLLGVRANVDTAPLAITRHD